MLGKVRTQAVKWTTEGAGNRKIYSSVIFFQVFRDVWHASVAGDMMVFHESTRESEARWHRGRNTPVLDRKSLILLGTGLFFVHREKQAGLCPRCTYKSVMLG